MAVDWDENLLQPLMSADVFGEDVQPTYQPVAGGSFPIDGVFDNAFLGVVLLSDGIPELQTVNPVLGVRLAQFPAYPISGDKVFIASVNATYLVNEVKPDGKGWAKLELTLSA